ncbi:hypothetical protein NHX12_028077 [Muraenolepis orangiensis]|uniref:DNA repair protein XRCC4 n=1 Tax=Muraenolepis orangiensis TaxID=630683 RepID=A0A9Q0EEV4_9TELE|nr:hypothetical protein NHX12_028077 [Muraenolepis orangiensis]
MFGVGVSAEMDVSVQEVDVPSEDGTRRKYFLRVDWRGRDLGSGFRVLLTDGQLAWRGEVTEEVVRCEAEELEMQKEKYVQDLHQALTGAESSVAYNFTLTPLPMSNNTSTAATTTTTTTTTTLAYEKVQKDISFQLGSVELCAVAEPAEAVRGLLALGAQRAGSLERQNHHLHQENHSLRVEQKYITAELQHYAEGKQALEAELYSRFVLVLNYKKKKIRGLQQRLDQLQQSTARSSEKQSVATASRSHASHQEEKSEDEYGGSTDEEEVKEEEEKEGRVEQAAVPTTSDSREADSEHLLDHDADDIMDVAPCRKRRFRHLPTTSAAAAAASASTSDPAAKRPPRQTTDKHKQASPSPAGSTEAAADNRKSSRQQRSKNRPVASPSAEDLFDDF